MADGDRSRGGEQAADRTGEAPGAAAVLGRQAWGDAIGSDVEEGHDRDA